MSLNYLFKVTRLKVDKQGLSPGLCDAQVCAICQVLRLLRSSHSGRGSQIVMNCQDWCNKVQSIYSRRESVMDSQWIKERHKGGSQRNEQQS